MRSKILAKILVICICVAMLPLQVFAEEQDTPSVVQQEETEVDGENDDPGKARLQGYIPEEFYGAATYARSAGVQHASKFDDYTIEEGIDVSYYNGDIDWAKVKDAGIQFAIIRVAYRGYGDSGKLVYDEKAITNIENAVAAGVPVGVYIYSQAINENEAVEEADFVLDKISGYHITLPVVLDFEYANDTEGNLIGRLYNANLSKDTATKVCLAFCERVEQAGYTPMVYANKDMLVNHLNASEISSSYSIWLAHYATSTDYEGDYNYWQYSATGQVDGISGNVDMDFRYVEKNAEDSGSSSGSTETGSSSGSTETGSSSGSTETQVTYTSYKTTTEVNYRSGPGTSYEVKGTLASGTTISVEDGYSKSADGYTWYRFKLNSQTYYIASKYVEKVTNSSSTSSSSSGSSNSNSSTSSPTYSTYKTTTSVNYRSGPGTSYAVKGTLASGKTISVENGYSKSADGYTWYRFKMNSQTYYIASKYVQKVTSSSSGSSSSSSPTYSTYKTTTSVNYRSGPGTSYAVKGTLASGKTISVENGYSKSANGYTWYRFKMNSQTYYIASKYVKKVTSSSTNSPTYSSYKTTTSVNYRSGPGTSYAVKGTLASGKTISVENGYSKSANGYTWYRFKMNSQTYYIASKYLKKV